MYRKRAINEDLTQFSNQNFPYISPCSFSYRYQAIIGIGGNQGDTKRRFEKLFYFFKRSKQLQLLRSSAILKNPPFGYLNQPFFYNAVMVISTNLQPKQLLRFLQSVEKRFRRKRSFKDAPRTLDLDILFFQNRTLQTKDLTIPHPGWKERESVLIPLMEVV